MLEILEGVSAAGLAVAGAAAVAGGLVRGFTGFGGALVMVPVLSLVLGPGAALAAVCASGVPVILQLLPAALRHAERTFVLPFAAAAFAAAPAGTWVLVAVPPSAMKVAISLAVLAMTAMMAWGWRFPAQAGPGVMAALGAAAGLVQGASGVGGPPAVAAALARPGPPETQRGNVIGAVSALGLCAAAPYWLHGLFTLESLAVAAIILPAYIGSTWVGIRLFSSRGKAWYRRAALAVLAAVGLVTLAFALHDYGAAAGQGGHIS